MLVMVLIVALTLGIVVDDTVHFLSNYLHARSNNHARASEAVHYAFTAVGTALWVTTTLTVGFSSLSLSDYQVNEQMGMLAVLTITIALALDFIMLPALQVLREPPP